MVANRRQPADAAPDAPLNRAGLVASVAEYADIPATKAVEAVNAVFRAIEATLRAGQEVRLTGFGTFVIARRKATIGRDPRTGAAIEVGPSTSVRFKPSRSLKEAVGQEGG